MQRRHLPLVPAHWLECETIGYVLKSVKSPCRGGRKDIRTYFTLTVNHVVNSMTHTENDCAEY